ncbi:hypothetical protein PR048_033194 [Dryococelus australis]|uniref:Uncharacterized protein n=1 Tax=Dryococelus australis TaxID=614101 RepID=A0ABQ9FZJ8_9NEOP|nr:hypothetical protein PR048_033194 [Dryococelus australis]
MENTCSSCNLGVSGKPNSQHSKLEILFLWEKSPLDSSPKDSRHTTRHRSHLQLPQPAESRCQQQQSLPQQPMGIAEFPSSHTPASTPAAPPSSPSVRVHKQPAQSQQPSQPPNLQDFVPSRQLTQSTLYTCRALVPNYDADLRSKQLVVGELTLLLVGRPYLIRRVRFPAATIRPPDACHLVFYTLHWLLGICWPWPSYEHINYLYPLTPKPIAKPPAPSPSSSTTAPTTCKIRTAAGKVPNIVILPKTIQKPGIASPPHNFVPTRKPTRPAPYRRPLASEKPSHSKLGVTVQLLMGTGFQDGGQVISTKMADGMGERGGRPANLLDEGAPSWSTSAENEASTTVPSATNPPSSTTETINISAETSPTPDTSQCHTTSSHAIYQDLFRTLAVCNPHSPLPVPLCHIKSKYCRFTTYTRVLFKLPAHVILGLGLALPVSSEPLWPVIVGVTTTHQCNTDTKHLLHDQQLIQRHSGIRGLDTGSGRLGAGLIRAGGESNPRVRRMEVAVRSGSLILLTIRVTNIRDSSDPRGME